VILDTQASLLIAAIGVGIGWAATAFVARPIRRFFVLRDETVRMVLQYDNLRARFHEKRLSGDITETEEDLTLTPIDIARLHDAQFALRQVAGQMLAFAYDEPIAKWTLSWVGFDPQQAADGLFGVANTIDTTGDTRVRNKEMLAKALRLPEHTL
jgi:hypothetical protein